jgi:plasmid maintenance system antidote protein VapI
MARQHDTSSLTGRILDEIEKSGRSAYSIAKAADLDPCIVQRFTKGTRDIYLGTADRLAKTLGLRLVEADRRRVRVGKPFTSSEEQRVP